MKRKQTISIIFYFILCNIIFSACNNKTRDSSLDGIWYADTEIINVNQDDIGLEFYKSEINLLTNIGIIGLGKFQLIKDTIIFKDLKEQTQKYKIIKHTKDSLFLSINGEEKRYHNKRLEYNDSLKYNKITLIFGESEKRRIVITLDSIGNIFTEKKVEDESVIKENFKLDMAKLDTIKTLFKLSCIDKTDTAGWDIGDDGIPTSIMFEYNGKSSKIKTLGNGGPFRIEPIIRRLYKAVINKIGEDSFWN